MRRREHYWSLFHKPEKNQINDLRTDQVEAIFAAIPKKQRSEWLVWKDGFRAWKPFEEFPQLLLSLRQVKEQSPQPPPPSPIVVEQTQVAQTGIEEKANFDISQDLPLETVQDLELSLAEDMEDERSNGRYAKKLEVHLVGGGRPFSTYTLNISMQGMQLADPLPAGLPRYFNIEIRRGDLVIPLVCSEIRESQGTPSNRVKIEVNDYAAHLQTLLLEA